MALTASLDRTPPTYDQGDTLTLTVSTAAGERDWTIQKPGTAHVDIPGVGAAEVTYVLNVPAGTPLPVNVADPDLTWTLVSDDGVTVVFTATA